TVLVCDRPQPVLALALSLSAVFTALHVSVAVAVPSAASSAAAVGLQPKVNVVPPAVITGNVTSTVQVTVRATAIAALPQASVAEIGRASCRERPVLAAAVSLSADVLVL